MSDNFLLFVPVDPNWQPTQAGADEAVAYIKAIGPGFECTAATFSRVVEFHHPFANWSGVICPKCRTDLEEWFYANLTTVYEDNQFTNLDITTPCCGLETSLNDLDFLFGPTAFSRFVIEVMNPDVFTTEAQDERIAALVGCDLRQIWMHV